MRLSRPSLCKVRTSYFKCGEKVSRFRFSPIFAKSVVKDSSLLDSAEAQWDAPNPAPMVSTSTLRRHQEALIQLRSRVLKHLGSTSLAESSDRPARGLRGIRIEQQSRFSAGRHPRTAAAPTISDCRHRPVLNPNQWILPDLWTERRVRGNRDRELGAARQPEDWPAQRESYSSWR